MSTITPKSNISADEPLYIYTAADMPHDADVIIFNTEKPGLELARYCDENGHKVLALIKDHDNHVDTKFPVHNIQALDAVDASQCNLLISHAEYRDALPLLQAVGFKSIYIAHPFARSLLAASSTPHQLKPGEIFDAMVTTFPSPQNDINIFSGDWFCKVPIDGLQTGWNNLNEDGRLVWASSILNGMNGLKILELGPYEGIHTYLLEKKYGAESIVAVESNPRAFLRCLIVKNLLDLKNSKFLLGDFTKYLQVQETTYDLIFASGVLYHMTDPLTLLEAISKRTKKVFLWTHFYDEKLVQKNNNLNYRFDKSRQRETSYAGQKFQEHCFIYRDGTSTTDHLGGINNYAYWMTLPDIVKALKLMGFSKVSTGLLDAEHLFGPNLSILAEKE